MYGYIYLTTNLVNGKMYIGKRKSSYFDPNYKGSGTYLWNAINKYGWDNFKVELLKECTSLKELNQAEKDEIRIREAVTSKDYYNIASGGDGGDTFSGLSDEEKVLRSQNLSRSLKGKPKPKGFQDGNTKGRGNKGKPKSEEARRHMSENHFKTCSDLHRLRVSQSLLGNTRRRGKKSSEETKQRVSLAFKGRVWINNGEVTKFVRPEEVNNYLNQGFQLGRGALK